MGTQSAVFSATSKAGTTRSVAAEIVAGKLVGTFRRVGCCGEEMVSQRIPIRGDLSTLAAFATKQPGMFCTWVDAKLGRTEERPPQPW
jgi:hypothetical protein